MAEIDSTPGSELRRKGITAVAWTVVRTWFVRLSSLVSVVVLARVLSPSQFGVVALATVFIAVATTFSDVGLTPSLIRSPDRSKIELDSAFWIGILVSTLLFVVLQILAWPIGQWFSQPVLEPVVRALAFLLPLTSLSSVPTAILTRDLKMKPLAVRQMTGATVGTAGAVILALCGAGVWALVFQTLCPAAIGVVILWRSVEWRPSPRLDRERATGLMRNGGAILASQLIHQLRDRGADLLIGSLLGAQPLGYWVIAGRLVRVLIDLFTAVVNSVSLPAFAATAHDHARLVRGIRYSIRSSSLISMPLFVGLAIVSPVLVPAIFGEEWRSTGPLAQIVVLTAALNTIQWLDSNIWWAIGKPTVELILTTAISLVQIVVVVVAAPFGLVPLALAILARTMILMAARMLVLRSVGDIPLSIYRDLPGILLATGVAAAGTFLAGRLLRPLGAWPYLLVEGVVMLCLFIAAMALVQRSTLIESARDVSLLRGRRSRLVVANREKE